MPVAMSNTMSEKLIRKELKEQTEPDVNTVRIYSKVRATF